MRLFVESGSISLRMGRVVSEILMMDIPQNLFSDETLTSRDYIARDFVS